MVTVHLPLQKCHLRCVCNEISEIKYPERILSFPGFSFFGPDTISETVWSIISLRGFEASAPVSLRRTRLPSRMRRTRPGEPKANPAGRDNILSGLKVLVTILAELVLLAVYLLHLLFHRLSGGQVITSPEQSPKAFRVGAEWMHHITLVWFIRYFWHWSSAYYCLAHHAYWHNLAIQLGQSFFKCCLYAFHSLLSLIVVCCWWTSLSGCCPGCL